MNKVLILRDLCARLPYKVKIELTWWVMGEWSCIDTTLESDHIKQLLNDGNTEIKPYLRPMSSMTDEERKELERISGEYFGKALDKQIQESLSSSNRIESEILEYIASSVIVDWLNAHHFDYRGLIEKSLALEAKEGTYTND